MKRFSFEKLEVWNISRAFTKNVYSITSSFPEEERFGLTAQIRRAVVSISSNIAEGSGRFTGKEQARFSEIAFASLMEVLNQLIIAVDLNFISEEVLENQRPIIEELANKLNKLRESQINKENK